MNTRQTTCKLPEPETAGQGTAQVLAVKLLQLSWILEIFQNKILEEIGLHRLSALKGIPP